MKGLLFVIVDDREIMRICQEDACQDLYPDADTITFSSAVEVLDQVASLVESHQNIIVITDYDMPEMSGVELVVHLRTQGYSLPFIMVSGSSHIRDDVTALNVPFLEKPYQERDLESTINAVLNI